MKRLPLRKNKTNEGMNLNDDIKKKKYLGVTHFSVELNVPYSKPVIDTCVASCGLFTAKRKRKKTKTNLATQINWRE